MNSTLSRADSRPASQRVVITGLGIFSSIGTGITEFTEGLRTGRSNVVPITAFDTSGFEYANGCEVTAFEPEKWIHHTPVKYLGRAQGFGVVG